MIVHVIVKDLCYLNCTKCDQQQVSKKYRKGVSQFVHFDLQSWAIMDDLQAWPLFILCKSAVCKGFFTVLAIYLAHVSRLKTAYFKFLTFEVQIQLLIA